MKSMKYLISYEHRSQGKVTTGQLTLEAKNEPKSTDLAVIEAAMRDAKHTHNTEISGISIQSITAVDQ